eukprot:3061620-Rhodomonas_salina.1
MQSSSSRNDTRQASSWNATRPCIANVTVHGSANDELWLWDCQAVTMISKTWAEDTGIIEVRCKQSNATTFASARFAPGLLSLVFLSPQSSIAPLIVQRTRSLVSGADKRCVATRSWKKEKGEWFSHSRQQTWPFLLL